MLHLVSGISSLYLLVNLILAPVPPSPAHLFLHPSLLPLLIYHHLSFTPGLKSTSFTNPSPLFSLLLPDCLHGLFPAPFLLSYWVFDSAFFIIFHFWAVR